IGERRLVPGFGVTRLAAKRQRDGERDAVLREHQVGGLQDVVALDHAFGAGDGDRLNLGAGKTDLGLQFAYRFDRGVRGRVARIALQYRGRDDELLAQPAGQFTLVPCRAEHLEEPELAFEDGAWPLEAAGSQTRGE